MLFKDLLRLTSSHNTPLAQENHSLAQTGYRRHIMIDKNDRTPRFSRQADFQWDPIRP
jgi:hypothetical protein